MPTFCKIKSFRPRGETLKTNIKLSTHYMGSGCGSVGRAVALDTRGPRFDSRHRQNFIEHLFIINCIEKTKINKKRLGMAHFFKKSTHYFSP